MSEPYKKDLLERIIEKHIIDDNAFHKSKRSKRSKFSGSMAGNCKRSAILNLLGGKESPFSIRTLKVFWMGTTIHEAVERILVKSGRLVAKEEFVGKYDGYIVGSFDFILRDDDGTHILYELKSINTGRFWTKIWKTKKPMRSNIYQAITYFMLIEKHRVDQVKIAYISKDDVAIATFLVNLKDGIVMEVNDWWEDLKAKYDSQVLPMPYLPTEPEYKDLCKNCNFKHFYCHENDMDTGQQVITQADIKKNVSELIWPKCETEKQSTGILTKENLQEKSAILESDLKTLQQTK